MLLRLRRVDAAAARPLHAPAPAPFDADLLWAVLRRASGNPQACRRVLLPCCRYGREHKWRLHGMLFSTHLRGGPLSLPWRPEVSRRIRTWRRGELAVRVCFSFAMCVCLMLNAQSAAGRHLFLCSCWGRRRWNRLCGLGGYGAVAS
jgi:hypothetical protein